MSKKPPDIVHQAPTDSLEIVELAKETNQKNSKKYSYSILFGLSIFSALVITSAWFTFQSGWLGLLYIAVIVIAQIILIIPATLLVFFIHRYLSRRNKFPEIQPLIRVGIPLLINSLPVLAFFTLNLMTGIQNDNFDNNLRQNLIVTVKENTIIRNFLDEYSYHAVLHIKNNTGKTIEGTIFSIDSYKDGEGEDRLGVACSDKSMSIPPGESNVEITIPLYPKWCRDKHPDQPLFLHYIFSAKNTNYITLSTPLSNDINKQLHQWYDETCAN